MKPDYYAALDRWQAHGEATRDKMDRLRAERDEARALYLAALRRINQELDAAWQEHYRVFRDYMLQQIDDEAPGALQVMRTSDDEAEVAQAIAKAGYVRPDGRLSRSGHVLWKHARSHPPTKEKQS